MEEIACNILYYIWFQQVIKISGPALLNISNDMWLRFTFSTATLEQPYKAILKWSVSTQVQRHRKTFWLFLYIVLCCQDTYDDASNYCNLCCM